MRTTKKVCILLTLVIWTGTFGGLGFFSRVPLTNAEPNNEIEAWTRGYLRENSYLKINKRKSVGTSSLPPTKGLYFWVIKSNSTVMMTTATESATGPFGVPIRVIKEFTVHNANASIVFPFTINIPKTVAKFHASSGEAKHWKVAENEKGWDSWFFKCKKVVNGSTTKVQKWILDADTHLTRHLEIIKKHPGSQKPMVKTVYQVTETSAGIKGGREIRNLTFLVGYFGFLIGPLTVGTIIYRKKENPVEREEERLESEEYKEKALERYEKKKRRLERS